MLGFNIFGNFLNFRISMTHDDDRDKFTPDCFTLSCSPTEHHSQDLSSSSTDLLFCAPFSYYSNTALSTPSYSCHTPFSTTMELASTNEDIQPPSHNSTNGPSLSHFRC
ncbi:hypothetical protein P9112_000116 [Eukaryota sp. TZLM1-RC]